MLQGGIFNLFPHGQQAPVVDAPRTRTSASPGPSLVRQNPRHDGPAEVSLLTWLVHTQYNLCFPLASIGASDTVSRYVAFPSVFLCLHLPSRSDSILQLLRSSGTHDRAFHTQNILLSALLSDCPIITLTCISLNSARLHLEDHDRLLERAILD